MKADRPADLRQRAREIFLEALDYPEASAREAFLATVCGSDPLLRRRVESMLSEHFVEDGFMARSASGDAVDSELAGAVGTTIGRYKLLQEIGEGGMGVVYLAEQQEPVRRKVALKLIKPGMDTRQVVARFEAERQALALMDHPNIAKVLDGGVTAEGKSEGRNPKSETNPNSEESPSGTPGAQPSTLNPQPPLGRPYFVMELVEGEPITEFCAKHELSLEERLRLFIPVCQAVQHAHQKGIIHRDLKPSNVMVTLQDGVPVPKVIDFGVAKAINQRLTEKTLFTRHATLIGTPAYVSPEQAELSGLDVDTRSDIYSLGVLLYELLTGTPPFPEERLRGVSYAAMQRIILHEEPERPSTRLRNTAATSAPPPLATRPRPLITDHRLLATDLDWIVLKCLEKDRNRRYETANGLAADLQRFLGNEPVVARPPSAIYRLQKTVRRNRLAFAAAAAVALSLLAGLGAASWQASRAGRERFTAQQQAARAEAAARLASEERARAERRLHATIQLLSETFTNVMPALREIIGATKPREDLAMAASQLAESLLKDAEPDPEMRRVLGELYLQLALVQGYYMGATMGEYDPGLESARKAIRFFQPSGAEVLDEERMDRLAWAELAAGLAANGLLQWDEALTHFANLGQWGAKLAQSTNQDWAYLGQEQGQWATALMGETALRRGQPGTALSNYFQPLIPQVEKRNPRGPRDEWQKLEELRESFDAVGRCLRRLGRTAEAETWFWRALPLSEQLADAHPSHSASAWFVAESKARLGEVLLAQARPDEAWPLLDSATKLVASLQKRDPTNPGFVQLEVEVLRCQVSGYTGWAEESSASTAERVQRLEQARNYLDRADQVIAAVRSASMQRSLRYGLADAVAELRRLGTPSEALGREASVGRAGDAVP